MLKDLETRNGTFVNNNRLGYGSTILLNNNDLI